MQVQDLSMTTAINLKKSGNLDGAISVLNNLIEKNPDYHWYYYQLGDCLEQSSKFEEAAKAFNRAIELSPNNSYLAYRLTRLKQGKTNKIQTKLIDYDSDIFKNVYTLWQEKLNILINDKHIKLPISEELLSSKNLSSFATDREKLKFLYSQIFGFEWLNLTYIRGNQKHPIISFLRNDPEVTTAPGSKLYQITDKLLTGLLKDSDFNVPPQKVCEIGGAWGATISHITNRFKVVEYQNYEIDLVYANYCANKFGTKIMDCDGETLSGTADKSIDLAIANNVLIFTPLLKAWSYLKELARVVNHGGVVLFNIRVLEYLQSQHPKQILNNIFPMRSHTILSQAFLDNCFPKSDFTLLRRLEKQGDTCYFIYKKVS